MSNLSAWSTTAGNNNASPPNGWPENMARSAVNDAAREMMAAIAKFYQDLDGGLVTAGSSNAYTLTTNSAHAALGDQCLFAFRADRANTGAATLNVDSLGAKNIRKDFNLPLESGDIAANQLMLVLYNANQDIYEWINPPAAAQIALPQGYLTLTSNTPVITGDVAAATSVYYTPNVGNLVPIYNGTRFLNRAFSQLTLTMHANHLANTIYDVFIADDGGTIKVGTGPAWSNSGAGTGARGTGAGTTELTRLNGILVNAQTATLRNGASTFSASANRATYVGSILVDGSAGQVTCHRSYGQTRRWAVWNAYNRKSIRLIGGDSTASWTYGTATVRAANGDSANVLRTFTGLQEETVRITFSQRTGRTTPNNAQNESLIGIGVNSTTTMSGHNGFHMLNIDAADGAMVSTVAGVHATLPLGLDNIQALEKADNSTTQTFYGTQANMLLEAVYKG